ncbi:RNA polymerase sigma factor [Chitinophaga lutea]
MPDTYGQEGDLGELWSDVLKGDENAYALMHRQLHPVLYRYAFAMLGSEDLAQDAVQEAFIRIWFKKEHIGPLRHVRAFFFTALRRGALNQLRGLRSLQILPAAEPDIAFSAEDIVIGREEQDHLRARISDYLNQLPKRQREVIWLRFYEELTYPEIADIMKINYQSVLNLAHKAIAQLRELMGSSPLWWLLLSILGEFL